MRKLEDYGVPEGNILGIKCGPWRTHTVGVWVAWTEIACRSGSVASLMGCLAESQLSLTVQCPRLHREGKL